MREVLLAGEEAQERARRSVLWSRMVPRSIGIARLERVEHRALRDAARRPRLRLRRRHARERAQVGGKHDADHGSVCTSTESTAGRSRTIGVPGVAAVGRGVHLAAGGAEVDAARVERIDRHRVAQHVDVAILLRQAVGQRLPLVAAGAAAIDAQLAVRREVLGVALDRHDVDRLRLVRVDVDDEAEIGRQIAADLVPVIAGVVAAHHVPVLLHEERVGPRRVHRDAVDAVADFGVRIGNVLASAGRG